MLRKLTLYWLTCTILVFSAAGGLLELLRAVPWLGAAAIITVIVGFGFMVTETD